MVAHIPPLNPKKTKSTSRPRKNYSIKLKPAVVDATPVDDAFKFDPAMFWIGIVLGVLIVVTYNWVRH